ncbi:Uncharacterized protein C18orf25 [Corvus brachyrhynchos]|uniref:Uncharacterized protein C18orf25 n=1 Tax=Corvus brachyrhynchos TaxID=85066 RepID=A0A091F732_CORBR|nr:Uncharacterized protein C18orf25 [Corvus brachyrhynchos]
MKMEAVGKAEELVDSEIPPKTSEKHETPPDEDGPIELETQTQKDSVPTAADSAVLSSMPCLLMELRRDSSESQLASTERAAKKTRQSSDKQNGRVTKVKGHRSQKHKERIRLLRQKREAAARKKYNLLQDSSTSDSDLTCDSSTSSSDDDEEVSGSSKTITAEIPDGPPVVAHYDISDTNSDPEVVNVDNLLAAAVVQEHNNSLGNQDSGSTWRTRGLLDEMSADTGHLDPGFLAGDKTSCGNAQANEEINIASSDSEVEIVGVQEHARCVHPRGGVIQSVSSWKRGSPFGSPQPTQPWTAVAPQQNWSSPPEVVDLTLDEDTRRKYLL